MNIINLRESHRRSSTTQRIAERRKVANAFGSPEWLIYIKNNSVDCPKFNRRKAERRTERRRLPDRREQYAAGHIHSKNDYARIFLTPAERQLIQDLYLSDLELPTFKIDGRIQK
jgi:hypothetical protein